MHTAMSEHEEENGRHQLESELLRAQEHKGYGDDEGERESFSRPKKRTRTRPHKRIDEAYARA
jgi:hypothetical protein